MILTKLVARGGWGLRLAMLVLAAAVIPACGSSSSSSTLLAITMTSPVNGGSTPRQPVVYVRFNKALDPATVIPTNVVLLDTLSNIIPAAVTYVDCRNEIRIVPTAALVAGDLYQITFFPTVTEADGTAYAGSLFYFTVSISADADRPAFAGATSAITPTQTTIDLTWVAAVDPSASGLVYDVFLSETSGCYDFTTPYLGDQSSTIGVPVTGLTAGTTYFFVVRARDAFGNVDLNELEQTATTLP